MAAKGCTLGFLQGCYLWKFTDAPRDDHTFTHMQAALNENIGSEKKVGKQQQQLKVVIEKSWGLENRLGNGLWQNILYTCINFPQIQQNLLMFYVRKKILRHFAASPTSSDKDCSVLLYSIFIYKYSFSPSYIIILSYGNGELKIQKQTFPLQKWEWMLGVPVLR